MFAAVLPPVHDELERAGIVELVGADHFYERVGDVLARFESSSPPTAAPTT